MLKQENLAANFCGLLVSQHDYQYAAIEWRILGQEQDGSMLTTWVSTAILENAPRINEKSHIGIYNPHKKLFQILYSFEKRENIIQASVNVSKTLLCFVIKVLEDTAETEHYVYHAYCVEIKHGCKNPNGMVDLLPGGSQQQVMTQFLWQKLNAFEKNYEDRMLLFNHEKCVYLLKLKLVKNQAGEGVSSSTIPDDINWKDPDSWCLDSVHIAREIIVKHFIWAQWDPIVQALYYIHLKPVMKSSLEKDDGKEVETTMTTLSAHQFHENLPRETVVSIRVLLLLDLFTN